MDPYPVGPGIILPDSVGSKVILPYPDLTFSKRKSVKFLHISFKIVQFVLVYNYISLEFFFLKSCSSLWRTHKIQCCGTVTIYYGSGSDF